VGGRTDHRKSKEQSGVVGLAEIAERGEEAFVLQRHAESQGLLDRGGRDGHGRGGGSNRGSAVP